MQNQALNMLMNQLKIINPTKANQVQNMIKNKDNPMELLKQVTSNYDDRTKEAFYTQAKQMGFSEDLLNQIK